MARRIASRLRRLAVRSEGRPVGRAWRALHRGAVRAIGAVVAGRARRELSLYARGSVASGDLRPGWSDIDIAFVAADARGRRRLERRWRRLCRCAPGIGRAVDFAAYDSAGLAEASAAPTLRATIAVHLDPHAPPDPAGLRLRPGLGPAAADWRLVRGAERRPLAVQPDRAGQLVAAWLELQFLWRSAITACVRPQAPDSAYTCVKLIADAVRIRLWLADGATFSTRRAALAAGLRAFPQDERDLRFAAELDRSLHGEPPAALAAALRGLVAQSRQLAATVCDEARAGGETAVLLDLSEPLALTSDASDALAALTGTPPALLPLADWRALAWPTWPDDAMAAVALDPCDPGAVAAAARAAGDWGPYAALSHGDLLVLPGPGLLRAVQCPVTDPVSFALLAGEREAAFPSIAGWSAADLARRALDEHRAWLGASVRGERHVLTEWMSAQARTSRRELQVLGWLLSAARAALFHESVQDGAPRLALTLAAAADGLDARGGGDRVACEAFAAYRAGRASGPSSPPGGLVAALRRQVLALEGFAFTSPRPAATLAPVAR